MGTSFEVEEGSDVTFRIVARGYKVGVLLFGASFQPNADGSYTVTNVRSNCSFTVMLAKAEGGGGRSYLPLHKREGNSGQCGLHRRYIFTSRW